MRDLKIYIQTNRPKYGFYSEIAKRMSVEGVGITPEGVNVNLQEDYESSRSDVVNMALRVLAERMGYDDIYNESSKRIMAELQKRNKNV